MANLAHRASQFVEKKFLIIHPTADGEFREVFMELGGLGGGGKGTYSQFFVCVFDLFYTEKVHFQHSAKFISQLINEKANYTLQVRAVLGIKATVRGPLFIPFLVAWSLGRMIPIFSILCVPQIYPDEGHFIQSEATRQHLTQSLVNFFEECFRLPERVFEEVLEEESEDEG